MSCRVPKKRIPCGSWSHGWPIKIISSAHRYTHTHTHNFKVTGLGAEGKIIAQTKKTEFLPGGRFNWNADISRLAQKLFLPHAHTDTPHTHTQNYQSKVDKRGARDTIVSAHTADITVEKENVCVCTHSFFPHWSREPLPQHERGLDLK